MSQVHTAGISSILMQMLRYFTHTQTGIQTATTDIFRQINPIFLFFKRVQSWSHVSFWDQRKFGWNHCYMSQVQTAGISSILLQMLRYFTDTQTGIQTATTDIFRQINPIFLYFKRVQSWSHMSFPKWSQGQSELKWGSLRAWLSGIIILTRSTSRLILMTK